jgi:hypothetical protein
MEKTNAPITLTPDQIIALVGHGATQEQLDGVRRELDAKLDRVSDKIDKVHTELDGKINRIDAKVDSKFNQMLAVLLANIAGMVALAYWLGSSQ